jgi:hypothetical protein
VTLAAVILAACVDNKLRVQVDAPGPDAPPNATVSVIACSHSAIGVQIFLNNTGTAFAPATATMPRSQMAQFFLDATHDLQPGHVPADSTISDPGFALAATQNSQCVMFSKPGTYGFHSGNPAFNGTLTIN